jgi:hypothetical protein
VKISAISLTVLKNAPYIKEHCPAELRLLLILLLLLLPKIGQRTWRWPIGERFSPSYNIENPNSIDRGTLIFQT